jgi:intracellular multiplication protein IcmL
MNTRQQTAPARPKSRGPWPSAEIAVATILIGQKYASDRLHYISRIVSVLSVALVISLIGNVIMLPNPPRYRYIPVSPSGIVLPQVPLAEPNHDDRFVVDWTIDAVTRLFSFDFLNYRAQLQENQKNLTAMGWESFQKLLKESNNFNAVLGNSFVLTAVPTGAGRITKTGIIGGNFAWKVEFPMLLSFRASDTHRPGEPATAGEGRVITDTWKMTVTVTRVGVFLNHSGLGIKAIVGERQH